MSLIRQLGVLLVLGGIAWGGHWAYGRYIAPDAPSAADQGRGRGRGGPAPVEVIQARLHTFEDRVEAVGTTRARQSIDIVPLTDGRLIALPVDAGTEVDPGQLLARLDDEIERADVAQAEAQLREAERALERARQLRRTNAMADAMVEQLTAEEAVARAELDRARRRLADRSVFAPFGGRIGLLQVDEGARVTDTTVITTLDDLSAVEVEFALPETLFGRLTMGMGVDATATAFPGRHFRGTVAEVDTRIDTVSRAFKVRAHVPNPDGTLPAGMFMRISVVLETREVLAVPDEAIGVQAAETVVFTAVEGSARRRPVTLGKRQGELVEITAGVEPGDLVIVRGHQSVRDGAAIRDLGPPAQPIPDAAQSSPRSGA